MILDYSEENILKAAKHLKNGDIVSFPTETVYGLGADATSDQAVKKIFELKGRPANNPLIVHIASFEKVIEIIDPDISAQVLNRLDKLKSFWPGPLSIILKKSARISRLVSAGGDTIAVRIPNHPIALELLKKADIPIAAPSANKSFAVSPTSAKHVEDSFSDQNIFILDGGNCTVGLESTVLDICNKIPTILRPGAITQLDISKCLDEQCQIAESNYKESTEDSLISPGLFKLHYAPKTPLVFLDEINTIADTNLIKEIAVILFSQKHIKQAETISKKIKVLSLDGNLEEVAQKLYSVIRELDKEGASLLAIERCHSEGIGVAILDRLKRARHLP